MFRTFYFSIFLSALAPAALAQIVGPQRYDPDLPRIQPPALVETEDPLEALAREALGPDAETDSLATPPGMPDLAEMDLDNDDRVTIAEWRSWMRRHRHAPAMNIALSELDRDGDGIISQAEYAGYGEDREILNQLGTERVAPTAPGAASPDAPGWNWGIQAGD